MPGSVSKGDWCHPRKPAGGERRFGWKRLSVALSALVVTGLMIAQESSVWAIGARLTSDPIGRGAVARARATQTSIVISSLMAAQPEDVAEAASAATLPEGASVASMADTKLIEIDRLATAHDSLAAIRVGDMRFPDGAIQAAWMLTENDVAAVEESAEPIAPPKQGMGRSVVTPSDRTPPSDLWLRMNNGKARGAKNEKAGWRFVPASVLPLFSSNQEINQARVMRGQKSTFSTAQYGRPTTTAAVLFATGEAALDSGACQELDRIASDLKGTIYPIEVRIHHRQTAAVARALTVRAYLVKRGVSADLIRITPGEMPGIPGRGQGPYRVDVVYTSG